MSKANESFRKAVERAYEAGLEAAEEKSFGYTNTRAYFDRTHNQEAAAAEKQRLRELNANIQTHVIGLPPGFFDDSDLSEPSPSPPLQTYPDLS